MKFFFQFSRKLTPRQQEIKEYLSSEWGLKPKRLDAYEVALRHKSVLGGGKYKSAECNERLELLGDAVLDTIVTEFLYDRFPEFNEGKLTKIRSRIVNRQTLNKVGERAGLTPLIEARIGNGDSKEKIIGNALEAWIGAIYMDLGFQSAKQAVIDRMMGEYMNIERVVSQTTDYKSHLIEWAQKQRIAYEFKTFDNDNHQGQFTCEIWLAGQVEATSVERSKKRSEKVAAQLVCQKFGLIDS